MKDKLKYLKDTDLTISDLDLINSKAQSINSKFYECSENDNESYTKYFVNDAQGETLVEFNVYCNRDLVELCEVNLE